MEVDSDVLQRFLTSGWGSMETQRPDPTPEQMDEQYRVDKVFHDTFSSGPGAECLQFLRTMTIEQPAWNPQQGLVGILNGFAREGQDSLVRYIETRMERAMAGPPSKQKKSK